MIVTETALKQFSRFLAGSAIDTGGLGDLSPAEADLLNDHCNRLSIIGLFVAGATTSIGALLPWFSDFIMFDPGSPEFEAMFTVRSTILLLTVATFLILRFIPGAARHPYLIGLLVFSTATGVSGASSAHAGGFDSPLAYAVYTTPLLSLVLFVDLKRRVLAATAILIAFFGALFLCAPDELSFPLLGVPLIWSVASAFAAIAAGHLVYIVIRANLIQRRKLDDLTAHLQDRISEQTEQIRRLTGSVFKVQEDERQRISHDLHDELGQMLFRLNMEVEMMQHRTLEPARREGSFGDSLHLLKHLVEQVHDSLDRILGALRPIALESQGFDVAVSRMARDISSRNKLNAEVRFNAEVDDFSDTAKTALYRIVQEGLTNIVKHAEASHADIEFRAEGEELALFIRDDGKGFDPEEAEKKDRLGLRSIQERAKLLNGRFQITKQTEGGTEISIVFPMRRIENGGEA